MTGRLMDLLRRLMFGAPVPEALPEPELPSERDVLYRRDRKYAHECGHAVLAWLSPAVESVVRITFLADGSAHTAIAFRDAHPSYEIEAAVILMGGLAGELMIWKRVWSGGFRDDIPKALRVLQAARRKDRLRGLERRWSGQLAESGMDVNRMVAQRPPPEIADALNVCYKRAKWLLAEHRAAFERLLELAKRQGDLTEEDIASRFGPRIWTRR